MECNKDEAVRSKEIAEKKLLQRDIIGAQKFALKAQSLFSELDGLSQFLDIINVYVGHEKKINGEVDYYGIFGVDPFADEETLKKQYKRMALSLHPDKNKSIGADGAFVILSQAWSILSDKDKRSAYDLKLNLRGSNQTSSFSSPSARYTTPVTGPFHVFTRLSTPGTTTSQPCSSSHQPRNTTSGAHFQYPPSHRWNPPTATFVGSQCTPAPSQYDPSPQPRLHPTPGTTSMNFPACQRTPPVPPRPRHPTPTTGNPLLIPRHRKTPTPACAAQFIPASRQTFQNRYTPFKYQPMSSTCPSRPETFWTLCNRCRIQYEYQKIYLNQNLLCPRCQQPFLATKMPAPNANSRTSFPSSIPHQQQVPAAASGGLGQPSSKYANRKHEMEVNMRSNNDHPMKNSSTVPENVGTASASCTVSGGLNREKPVKKRQKDAKKFDRAKEESQGTVGYSGVKRAFANVKGYSGERQQSSSVKELSPLETRVMLIGRAKTEILNRLNEWESEKSDSSHLKRVDRKDSVDALMVDSINHQRTDKRRDGLPSDPKNTQQPQNSPTLKETDLDAPDEFVSMVVPDANFHNFDNDRVEKSFSQGQIWAAYDDDDGMPRYYALVHQVISRSPFKMQISWLNSKSSSEFGPLEWIASGFTKTSGDFRIGKCIVSKRLNSFSHPVKSKKGVRGVIQIFPTKGDVWALYRNWSPDWNETTSDEIVHKYDLVVVLEDYSEDEGVLVAPLVKVPGFTSVFNQVLDEREIRTIPREEMFRFSHQVPFYMLNGLEAENAPEDCYELDPAALPLELLKVITDAKAAERRVFGQPVNESEAMAEPLEERGSFEDTKHLLKYSRRNKEKKIGGNFFQQSQQSASLDAC